MRRNLMPLLLTLAIIPISAYAVSDQDVAQGRSRLLACYGETSRSLDDGSTDVDVVARVVVDRCSPYLEAIADMYNGTWNFDRNQFIQEVRTNDLRVVSLYILEIRSGKR
jgi:hypothetical protein